MTCDTERKRDSEAPKSSASAPFSRRQVWVDVGTKKEGVQGFQRLLGIDPQNCLHVGDQFLITGNDYASRSACCSLWITNPSETKRVLHDILSQVDPTFTPPTSPNRKHPDSLPPTPNAATPTRASRPPSGRP